LLRRDMPKKYALGFGNGRIMEYEDGTAAYIPPMAMTQAFRVKIADVTGFSVIKGGKMMERTINVMGSGTLIASASVNHGVSEKIEAWFRSHPDFGKAAAGTRAAPVPESPGPPSTEMVADELKKLAELRDQGVLTQEEFAAQKAKLLNP
jgi:Short C-terminal domain